MSYDLPELSRLRWGPREVRVARGEELLQKILPDARRAELAKKGVSAVAKQHPSHKNPKFIFIFQFGSARRVITATLCERRLYTYRSSTFLHSLEQLEAEVEKTIRSIEKRVGARHCA